MFTVPSLSPQFSQGSSWKCNVSFIFLVLPFCLNPSKEITFLYQIKFSIFFHKVYSKFDPRDNTHESFDKESSKN